MAARIISAVAAAWAVSHALSAGARGARDRHGWLELDAPFSATLQRYHQTQDASLIWEGHKAGRDIGYCHLEKLANLDQLPATGFEISCFPVKIKAASAGWTVRWRFSTRRDTLRIVSIPSPHSG